MRIVSAFIVFAFLIGASPALAQQDVEMPREMRVLVQKGLTALGFDAGPADGLFGRKTRAAIWDWQEVKGLDTSGYLSQEEAEALAAVGAEAVEKAERESASARPGAAREKPTSADRAAPQSATRKTVGKVFRTPRCIMYSDRKSRRTAGPCWAEVENHEDCDIWRKGGFLRATPEFTWSGQCEHNAAHGDGTLRIRYDKLEYILTGKMVGGKREGRWDIRGKDGRAYPVGSVFSPRAMQSECAFVNGFRSKCVHMVVASGGKRVFFTQWFDSEGRRESERLGRH